MAFKSVKKKTSTYDDIESLFRDLKTKGIEALYSHQSDILREYQSNALKKSDVAIELPTGSGKTLIGLLIGEFRRLKYNERVLFLCPTIQLVNQVVDLANNYYGIKATPFIGSKNDFGAKEKTEYRNAESIAVATYGALFNSNPFFKEANLIILDDSHVAENYVASNWSLTISRKQNKTLYKSIIELIREKIDLFTYKKLISDDINPSEMGWVYIYDFEKYSDDYINLYELIEGQVEGKMSFPWGNIKNNLHACNFFFSWNEILIRPLIPPTLENSSFSEATQRIFMSATLGNGGDLERMTGVKEFHKIHLPSGWDKQGLGRRYFNFPNQSLDDKQSGELVIELIKEAQKAVVLVSSSNHSEKVRDILSEHLTDFLILEAKDIENSKRVFTEAENAVIVLANRFDGLDFPGDDCRLVIVIEIPYVANIQERFIQSRSNASVLFYDRNRTRLIQAIGRCTRSPKDYSAVYSVGEEGLSEWLLLADRHQYLHPELQAEIKFGLENSKEVTKEDFLENFKHFIAQDRDWKDANDEIIELRSTLTRIAIPGEKELESSVKYEIDFQYNLWEGKYKEALESSLKVVKSLAGGPELKGYRALWYYLHSLCAYKLYQETKADEYKNIVLSSLQNAAGLSSIYRMNLNLGNVEYKEEVDINIITSISRLTDYLRSIKITNYKKYLKNLDEIEKQLNSKDQFENANQNIGSLLGFETGNSTDTGAPDPWWIINSKLVIVFEDKIYESDGKTIPFGDIRQATSHQDWLRSNIDSIDNDAKIITVFISNSRTIDPKANFMAQKMYYWNLEDFRSFSSNLLAYLKTLSITYGGFSESSWKEYLLEEFKKRRLLYSELTNYMKPLDSISG